MVTLQNINQLHSNFVEWFWFSSVHVLGQELEVIVLETYLLVY